MDDLYWFPVFLNSEHMNHLTAHCGFGLSHLILRKCIFLKDLPVLKEFDKAQLYILGGSLGLGEKST